MMTKIVYDFNSMKCMSLFESLTKAKLKDCILDEKQVMFIVQQNEMGKAIGPKGANVHRLERLLKKKIKLVEFDADCKNFIKNLIQPLKVLEIKEENSIYTITAPDTKTRGYLIGRNASTLRSFESVVKRYFPIQEIRVA